MINHNGKEYHPDANGWYPIDCVSAVGDNWVILYQDNGIWVNKISCCQWGMDDWWIVNDNKHFPPLRGAEPTHWRPLPKPPVTQEVPDEVSHR